VRGGRLQDLLQFLNIKDPKQRLLLLVCIVSSLVPNIPHPALLFSGPQGSAKTTAFRLLRRLVDPSAVEVLTFPTSVAELVQQLSHHWAPYYDNLTGLSGWTSDALARSVTGEGFSKRQLYSDDEDVIYTFRRCIGLNGINVVARKPDLLDRCVLFSLEPINESERRSERELFDRFEKRRPGIVGAMFDTLAEAMVLRPRISLASLPRLADFTVMGCAIAEALGYSKEAFLEAYHQNMSLRDEEVLDSSPLAAAIVAFMDGRACYEGTPSGLLEQLSQVAARERIDTANRFWPKAANVLTRRLNEVRTNLLNLGICFTLTRGAARRITITRGGVKSSPTVTEAVGPSESESYALGNEMGYVDPYLFEERAAIAEFDGGLTRDKAEELARRELAIAVQVQ
jgi:DNA polymerase III delta prime subunit